ncbi:MAG: NAD(P)H-hydrate epimerase [Anaerolineae bacterium]|nr:NAD(P)H-hydrate epimerase [Anaerolineae bacterium]
MVEVDRLMIEDYEIGLVQMMENAGHHLAALARDRFLSGFPTGKTVSVLAGRGGNGGGALVAARHLANWGADVTVRLSRAPDTFSGVPAHQLTILQRMGLTIQGADVPTGPPAPSLILDGLIGYSLSGPPRGAEAGLIAWANAQPGPILALDTPSGLDITTGEALGPTIRAAATLTLALPKRGLLVDKAQPYVGELYLADISVPPALYAVLGLSVDCLFSHSPILHLTIADG